MNKKVSEIMDDIDYNELNTIELDEKINEDISFDRIKSIAMNAVTDEYKSTNRKKKHLSKFIIIPAAAVLILMSVTAFALTASETFRAFFGDSVDFIMGKTQDVQKSYTQNGITFTVESAVVDDTSGLVIFSLVKEDGTAFDKNTAVGDIKLSTGDGYSFGRKLKFTEDYKKLLYYIDPSNDGKLYGKKLNITVQNLVTDRQGESEIDMDLSEIYKNNPIDTSMESNKPLYSGLDDSKSDQVPMFSQNLDSAHGIQLMYEIPEYRIIGAGFASGKLTIASSLDRPNGNSSSYADIYKLIDTRTGEALNSIQATRYDEEGTEAEISQIVFDVSDIKSLKYLKPVISYNLKNIIVEGEWSVDFKLQKNIDILKLKSDVTFDEESRDGSSTITINEIDASIIAIKVRGICVGKPLSVKKLPELRDSYILMKDGTISKFNRSSAGFDGKDGFVMDLRVDGLIDVSNIKSINIAGYEFSVQ